MIYTKEMSVGEIYKHHPVGQDLLNILAGLGGKKYGFCENPHVGDMSLNFTAQMLAHLVDERCFDQMIEILNKNPMEIETYTASADDVWWKKAVFYQCEDCAERTFQKAAELGVDCVVVPWDLFGSESLQEVIHRAAKRNLRILLKTDIHFPQRKTDILKNISELLDQGIHGIVLEKIDLLTAEEMDDKVIADGRMAAIGGAGAILFDPEIELFAGELLKRMECCHAVLIGETVFDGIALDAARTLGSRRAFHLITHRFSAAPTDWNDLKNEICERYEAVPEYWPVLNFETVSGISMADAAGELSEKAHTLLAALLGTLRGTMYLHQNEVSAAEDFYKRLLQLRRQYLHTISGKLCMENQKLYDVMTYERIADTGGRIRVECNLSERYGVLPCGRPENRRLLLSNYETEAMVLRPYEVNVYECS